MYLFNPTSAEANVLAQIRQHESGNNYNALVSPATCAASGATVCTASGAYQFINSTWAQASRATGVDLSLYPTAASAPASVQDINALWLLRAVGPNSSASWGGGGVYYDTSGLTNGIQPIGDGSTGPLVDLSGADASTPTTAILDQLNQMAGSFGLDTSSELTTWMLVGAAVIGAYYLLRR